MIDQDKSCPSSLVYNGLMKTLPILGPLDSSTTPSRPGYASLPEHLCGSAWPGVDALYVHVPFCSSKCHYCDFYSIAGHLDQAEAFLDALARESHLHVEQFGKPAPRTIFVGGGTPTLLSPEHLQQLVALLHAQVDFSQLMEFTVEANPNTFDSQRAQILRGGGVNRISFGAQSFHRAELQMLQRDHDPASVAAAFAIARSGGITNLNLDLIFGIPGQTLASWSESLDRALELHPSHMSCYSLTYEPNTAMNARLNRGEFTKIDEETELAMFDFVYRRLGDAGFTRYEISNYARTAPCLHNLCYWKAGNWLGWGPSAGSHIAVPHAVHDRVAWQWKNVGSLNHYLEALSGERPQLPLTGLESLSRKKWSAAAAVFWLRLNEGLSYPEFQSRTAIDPKPILQRVLAPFADLELATLDDDSARITDRGVAVSNHILSRVLAAFEA
jgi:oxygen-independent coproporphyrinogen III oxidase